MSFVMINKYCRSALYCRENNRQTDHGYEDVTQNAQKQHPELRKSPLSIVNMDES